jgi:hypothetical protein
MDVYLGSFGVVGFSQGIRYRVQYAVVLVLVLVLVC